MNTAFLDESGRAVKLGDYFTDKPVVLVPIYYQCPMLCSMTLNGILAAARSIKPTAGPDYQVLAFSINPKEGPELARGKKETYDKGYNRPGSKNGWHFLTGDEDSIRQLTQAINFRFVYDAKSDQYAHASGAIIATPDGRIGRTLYGPDFKPRDLKLALAESGRNEIGSITDKVLLYCYAFDGATGRYTMSVMRVVKLAGAVTVVLLFTGVGVAFRREKKRGENNPESGERS